MLVAVIHHAGMAPLVMVDPLPLVPVMALPLAVAMVVRMLGQGEAAAERNQNDGGSNTRYMFHGNARSGQSEIGRWQLGQLPWQNCGFEMMFSCIIRLL